MELFRYQRQRKKNPIVKKNQTKLLNYLQFFCRKSENIIENIFLEKLQFFNYDNSSYLAF